MFIDERIGQFKKFEVILLMRRFFCSVVVSLILQGLQFFFISREASDVDIGFGWMTVFSIEFVSMEF